MKKDALSRSKQWVGLRKGEALTSALNVSGICGGSGLAARAARTRARRARTVPTKPDIYSEESKPHMRSEAT